MVWSTLSMVSQYFFYIYIFRYPTDSFVDCKAMCNSVEGCKFVNSKLIRTYMFFQLMYRSFSSLLRCQWQSLFQRIPVFIFIFTDAFSSSLSSCRMVAPSSLARCSRSAIPALTLTTVVVRLNPMVASIISPTPPDGAKTKKVLISS
jgi:hypothetical protein